MCNVSSCFVPSAPLMSVEEPGVGGKTVRGIADTLREAWGERQDSGFRDGGQRLPTRVWCCF
jgi:hypothetical protein